MIRPAWRSDIPRLVRLGVLMHEESRYSRLRLDQEKLANLLASLIDGDHGCVLVAERDREVVGGIVGVLTEHWCSNDTVATDLALFLAPEARGGMLAARLVNGFVAWAKEQGAAMISMGISTGVSVEATGRLYEACGGRQYGTLWEWT